MDFPVKIKLNDGAKKLYTVVLHFIFKLNNYNKIGINFHIFFLKNNYCYLNLHILD